MSSKSIHHTSNKNFSDFRQLSKQHHQVEICEASHFYIILELVAHKLIFLNKQVFVSLKLQEMYILAAWNCHGKNEFMLKMYFYLFFEIKDSLLSVWHSEQSFLASDIFTIEFGRH